MAKLEGERSWLRGTVRNKAPNIWRIPAVTSPAPQPHGDKVFPRPRSRVFRFTPPTCICLGGATATTCNSPAQQSSSDGWSHSWPAAGRGTSTQILTTKRSGRGDGHTKLIPGSPTIISPSSPTHSAPGSQHDPSGALKSRELGTGSWWGGQQLWCEMAAVSTCPLADPNSTSPTKDTELEPQRHQGSVWRLGGDVRRSKATGRLMLAALIQFVPRAIKSFLCTEMGCSNLNILPLAPRHEEVLEAY